MESVQSHVLDLASKALSHPLDGDAWDPVSMAGWHAAWTAALVAVFTFVEAPVPHEIQEQWHWFQKGHWPCGYLWVMNPKNQMASSSIDEMPGSSMKIFFAVVLTPGVFASIAAQEKPVVTKRFVRVITDSVPAG